MPHIDNSSHRLNMELFLLGLHVHSCTHWLISRTPPSPFLLLLGSCAYIRIKGRCWSAKMDDIPLSPPDSSRQVKSTDRKRGAYERTCRVGTWISYFYIHSRCSDQCFDAKADFGNDFIWITNLTENMIRGPEQAVQVYGTFKYYTTSQIHKKSVSGFDSER